MNDLWRELSGQLHDHRAHQPNALDLQLDRCLLALARYLVEADRERSSAALEALNLLGDAPRSGR